MSLLCNYGTRVKCTYEFSCVPCNYRKRMCAYKRAYINVSMQCISVFEFVCV